MIEVTGDLWQYDAEVTAITTNGVVRDDGKLVMGGGCALEAAQRYPWLPEELGQIVAQFGNHCHEIYCEDDGTMLLSFPTKEHYAWPSTRKRILESAREAAELADDYGWQSIVIPRPGCGLGGLDWSEVKEWLESVLDDRFHIITFDLDKNISV